MGKSLAFGLPFEGHASGGGILILADLRPDEDAEFIELEPPAPIQAITQSPPALGANGHAIRAEPAGPHIALDENAPEADPPESFEVRVSQLHSIFTDMIKPSTPLIMTHES